MRDLRATVAHARSEYQELRGSGWNRTRKHWLRSRSLRHFKDQAHRAERREGVAAIGAELADPIHPSEVLGCDCGLHP